MEVNGMIELIKVIEVMEVVEVIEVIHLIGLIEANYLIELIEVSSRWLAPQVSRPEDVIFFSPISARPGHLSSDSRFWVRYTEELSSTTNTASAREPSCNYWIWTLVLLLDEWLCTSQTNNICTSSLQQASAQSIAGLNRTKVREQETSKTPNEQGGTRTSDSEWMPSPPPSTMAMVFAGKIGICLLIFRISLSVWFSASWNIILPFGQIHQPQTLAISD